MRLLGGFLLALAAVNAQAEVRSLNGGKLVLDGIPEIDPNVAKDLESYQNARSASLSGWLADGSGLIVSTRFAETSQLHMVNQAMGARQQLTFFNEPVYYAAIRPGSSNPASFLFLKDKGGNENAQIFLRSMKDSSTKMLSDGKSRYGGLLWAKSGKFFLFSSNERNSKDTDVYWMNPDTQTMKRLTELEGTYAPLAISPSENTAMIMRYISINESEIYQLEISSGKIKKLFPQKDAQKIAYGALNFGEDSDTIYYVSDENTEFRSLRERSLKTGKEKLISASIPWDVGEIALSDDKKRLAFVTNENGLSKLYVYDTSKKQVAAVKGIPEGQLSGISFHPSSKKLALSMVTSKTPGDIFVYDFDKKSWSPWTKSETGDLSTDTFVSPRLIEYPSFDKVDGKPRKIPAFYYSNPENKEPKPVVIVIHGGPESQFRPSFSPLYQYIVGEFGAAVIAPNVRGSSGYGKTYLKLDNWELREDSVRDIGSLLDWIEKQPELDASRVVVYGGSYGGYMVLASMAHYNERLAGGIDVVGISNFVTFLENTKSYRRDLRRVEYGDERIPEMRKLLTSISPTENVHKITKPLFVAQGLNDPRVPASEAEQIVEKVRKSGGEVWYMLAKDEGHGFRKKANSDVFQQLTLMFLKKTLSKQANSH